MDKHELAEADLMQRLGMTYEDAHRIANKIANYKRALQDSQ
ncbi:hypothetical protein [Lacticaseibacillus salsurivasis]